MRKHWYIMKHALTLFFLFFFFSSVAFAAPEKVFKLDSIGISASKEVDGTKSEIAVKVGIPPHINPNVFLVESPFRIVLDFPGIRTKKDESFKIPGNKIVSQVRIGAHPDKLRMVIDILGKETPKYTWSRQGKNIVVMVEETVSVEIEKIASTTIPTVEATSTPEIAATSALPSQESPTSVDVKKIIAATPESPDTVKITPTKKPTVSPTPTKTPTSVPTLKPTKTLTVAPTATSTKTPKVTNTPTQTATAVNTAISTPTIMKSPTKIAESAPTLTSTATPSSTPTKALPTETATSKPSATMTVTKTATVTKTSTPLATSSPTKTPTKVPTATSTVVSSPTSTALPITSPALTSKGKVTPAVSPLPQPQAEVLNARWSLSEIRFDYLNPGRVPIIKLILSAPRARVQMTKMDAETYKLIIPETTFAGTHLSKPQFPPSDFSGFQMIQSTTTPDGIEIIIKVDKGAAIGAFVRNNEVWMKKL